MAKYRLKPNLFTLILLGLLALPACSGPARSGDVAPVEEGVLPAPATVETTPSPEPAPAETTEPAPDWTGQPAISLNISGGILGFCDSLVVDRSGAYTWQTCRGEESKQGSLRDEELQTLQSWTGNLAGFSLTREDNPGGPDNMVSELTFSGTGSQEADQAQQQVIFDWANGLLVRLFPQPEPPPTAEPTQGSPAGLCPELGWPAVLVADFDNPANLVMVDPATGAPCNLPLTLPPFGRLVAAAGHIYYPAFDPEAETISIWQISPDGRQTPLDFTITPAEQFGPFSLAVSADGRKIAWGRAAIETEVDPPLYRNELKIANLDGSEQVTLLDQAENSERRFVEPIRFSRDNRTLFYTLHPDGLGGAIFSFSGRYDNLYAAPAAGGQPELLFACPAEAALCISDISPDSELISYADPAGGQVKLLNRQGGVAASLTPPAGDYIGPALFGPDGSLALVSAALLAGAGEEDPPRPNPGTISLFRPPYTGQPETLISNNSVMTIWEWLDESRLVYGSLTEAGSIGTALVDLEGQARDLSESFALAVLR